MIEFVAPAISTYAVRHSMWVEKKYANSIPSHTGRNKIVMGQFFYPHFIPDRMNKVKFCDRMRNDNKQHYGSNQSTTYRK